MKTSSTPTLIKTNHQPAAPTEREEKVRVRAYELYEKRGRVDGFALEDWVTAEAEFTRPKTRAASAPGSSN